MSDIKIIEPETVTHAKKQAAKQRQLERRGIAREILSDVVSASDYSVGDIHNNVKLALLDATKVED